MNEGSSPTPPTQIAAVSVPEDGGEISIGASATLQEFVAASTAPKKIISIGPLPEPSVVGCTATTSFPAATGSLAESAIASAAPSAGTTTNGNAFDWVPSGFCAVTLRVAAEATSAAVSVIVQDIALGHVVVREEPLTKNVVPGPGLVATKL